MARKLTVDVDKILEMLREGKSTQSVAQYFGVSRQAIDLHRKKLIENGVLEEKRASRGQSSLFEGSMSGGDAARLSEMPVASSERKPLYDAGPPKPATRRPSGDSRVVSLDRMIELIIEAFDSLKKLPQLEAELEKCRSDYLQALGRIAELEKMISLRNEQEARWRSVGLPSGNPRP